MRDFPDPNASLVLRLRLFFVRRGVDHHDLRVETDGGFRTNRSESMSFTMVGGKGRVEGFDPNGKERERIQVE